MPAVSITYCRPCGYHRRATDTAAQLRAELGVEADLIAGSGGVYQVRVGDVVVAGRAKGYFPDAADVVEAVRAAIRDAPA